MDVVLADPLVVALILGLAGMPATGALVCKRWREALEYPEAWIHLDVRLRDKGLYAACSAGDLKFVQQRASCLLTDGMPWIAKVMLKAASGRLPSNLELVSWIAQKFDISRSGIDSALYSACRYGELQAAQWLIEHYNTVCGEWLATGAAGYFRGACAGGKMDTAKWLTARFKIRKKDFDAKLFCQVCDDGYLQLAKWMASEFELTREFVYQDWAVVLLRSIAWQKRELALWLICRFGVTEVNLSWFNVIDDSIKASAGGLWLVKQLGLNCRPSAHAICAHVRQIVAPD
jgi:hypothetical protein